MFGEEIISIIFGGSKFFLIIVSNPLPIETIKKVCGMIPIIVANKKFLALTLKRVGNMQLSCQGIPPINL